MEASRQPGLPRTAADKAFHLAILDATHNPVLQGFRGAIDTILSAVFVVAVDSVDGWFEGNLPNHAAIARAIEEGTPKKPATPWSRCLATPSPNCAGENVGANRRNAGPDGPRDLEANT